MVDRCHIHRIEPADALDPGNSIVGCRRPCYGLRPMEPHPWLQPVERRVGVAVLCTLWLGFEAYYDMGGLWFWLALGATVYAIWDFFLSGTYRDVPK